MKENLELIKRALTMFCVECGKRDHEYVFLDVEETINGKRCIIHKVPTICCNHCGALAYPSFGYEYLEQQREIFAK